jgi:hypothetical protein
MTGSALQEAGMVVARAAAEVADGGALMRQTQIPFPWRPRAPLRVGPLPRRGGAALVGLAAPDPDRIGQGHSSTP